MNGVLVRKFLSEIENAKTLKTAQAFAKSLSLILDDSDQFSVVLESIREGQKISVIKEIRELFKIGLKEAKDDSETPSKKWGPFPNAEAQRIAKTLRDAGAVIRLQ